MAQRDERKVIPGRSPVLMLTPSYPCSSKPKAPQVTAIQRS